MKNINHLVLEKLKEKERSITWLARHVGCNSGNLRKILHNKNDIYAELLYQISDALETDFHGYYSQRLIEKRKHKT